MINKTKKQDAELVTEDQKENSQIDNLQLYLHQANRCREQIKRLKDRHEELTQELKDPGRGTQYHTMPRSGGMNPESSVSVVFRIAEIESRIDEQKNHLAKKILLVMDIMDFLPSDSIGRSVLEARYIDNKPWDDVAEIVFMSRSSCFNYHKATLEELLTFPRVKHIVDEFIAANKQTNASLD